MKKFGFIFSFLMVLILLSDKVIAQSQVLSEINNSTVDTYVISISGNALNSTTALNLTVAFDNNGSVEFQSTVTLKGNGAAQLLSEVKGNLITVLWSGAISDGKATVTGKFKPGTVTGNPTITVTKVEAAGGNDITNSVVAVVTTLNSKVPVATPTPSPSVSPSPSPVASPTPSPTPEEALKITAPDTYNIRAGINFFKLRADAVQFKSTTDCDISTSDESFLKVRPSTFILSPFRKRKIFIARIPSSQALSLQSNKKITITATCKNNASDKAVVLITPLSD